MSADPMTHHTHKAAVLKQGIRDYLDEKYENPRKHRPGTCKHNTPYYQTCESCIDAHFNAVLRAAEAIP